MYDLNSYTFDKNDSLLIANWKTIDYSISFNLDGGQANNLTTYTVEHTFTLTNPTKEGYTFIGWSGTGIDNISKTVTIKKGSIGNRTYTAN